MLLDSNILIYATQPNYQYVRDFIANNSSIVSVISKIEVLGYHNLSLNLKSDIEQLFELFEIIPISDEIADEAIVLRQRKKISLGDSLIAATAIIHNKTLVTANIKDFDWITNLTINNPIKP